MKSPNTEGYIQKNGGTEMGDEEGGRGYSASRIYGWVCNDYQHLNRVNGNICLRWIYHIPGAVECFEIINQVSRGGGLLCEGSI